MSNLAGIMGLITCLCVAFLVTTAAATAQDSTRNVGKSGVYASLSISKVSLGGDFDGNTIVFDASEVNAVPKLDSKFAVALGVGYRAERFSVEFNYSGTTHSATFLGIPADVKVRSYGLYGRFFTGPFVLANRVAQAYLLSGFVIVPLTVADGSYTEDSNSSDQGRIGDATYHSYGTHLGLGVEAAVWGRIRLTADVGYRILRYFSVSGARNSATPIQNGLSGNGFSTSIGFSLILISADFSETAKLNRGRIHGRIHFYSIPPNILRDSLPKGCPRKRQKTTLSLGRSRMKRKLNSTHIALGSLNGDSMINLALVLLIALSLSGCSYKLNYSLNQREISMAKSPSRLRVAVMPLNDNRDASERSKEAREAVGHPDAGDFTYDDDFAGKINLEISKMLVQHLEYSGSFQEVVLIEASALSSDDRQKSQLVKDGYDAVLTGSIDNFVGYYDRNSTNDFLFRGLLPAGATIAATLVSIKTETKTFRQPFGGATEFKETTYDPILPSLVLLGTSATGNLIASSSKRDISWQTALTLELSNLRTGERLWSDRTEVKDQVHASMPSIRNKKRKQEVAVRSLRGAINKMVESLDQSSASLVAAKRPAGSQNLK